MAVPEALPAGSVTEEEGVQVAVVGVVTVPVAPLGDPRVNDPLDIGA